MQQRIDKILANSGMLTRSQAKEALRQGRVQLDGVVVKDGACKLDPDCSTVLLDGQAISTGKVALMLNKPAGYVTSTDDPRDQTVMELIPPVYRRRVTPVGRLDKQTEGLLLLTDDGELAHWLLSPKNRVPKVYYAEHVGTAAAEDVEAFAQGLTLADGTRCLPARLEPLGPGKSLITVCEGKYHQVRRMMAARSMQVQYLERRAEGELTLGDLPRGECRAAVPCAVPNSPNANGAGGAAEIVGNFGGFP